MKKILLILIVLFIMSGCNNNTDVLVSDENDIYNRYPNAKVIVLDDHKGTIEEKEIKEYDYTFSLSKDNIDEIYEGDKPKDSIYISHDIIYYPSIDEEEFSLVDYDGEKEWATYYTAEGYENYIFGLLPYFGEDIPTEMMHSEEEAYDNPVLHINEAGEYILEGNFNGQIAIDLGEDSFTNEDQKVTLIFNGVDVNCDVAPSFIVYNAYEVDNNWEEETTHPSTVNLTNAGIKIILVDGSENNFVGANVYRLLKAKYKDDSNTEQKKRYKYDGSFYSTVSMLIESEAKGTGILNITSTTYEGLDTELHLTINSGYINIYTQDDGINVNEDDVSIFTMNDGHLTIFAGQGREGDAIDSNGYININGGIVAGTSPSVSDHILDSNNGTNVSEDAIVYSGGNARTSEQAPMMPGNDFNPEFPGQPPKEMGERPEPPLDKMPN